MQRYYVCLFALVVTLACLAVAFFVNRKAASRNRNAAADAMKKAAANFAAGEHGQALIEFTLLLPVIIGVLSIIIDGGFMMYRKMECKSIAQSAAFAAAAAAYNTANNGCGMGITCGSYTCPSNATIDATNNISNGCVVGQMGDSTPDHNASITAVGGVSALTGINPQYWVKVTVRESTPVFFAPHGDVAATSTAAVFKTDTMVGVYVIQ